MSEPGFPGGIFGSCSATGAKSAEVAYVVFCRSADHQSISREPQSNAQRRPLTAVRPKFIPRERATMKKLLRSLLVCVVAINGLTGCCVTGLSMRKSSGPCPNCQSAYEPLPQGIAPTEVLDPQPAPVPPVPVTPTPDIPPSPSAASRGGFKTAMQGFGDSVRDTFRRY